MRDTKPALLALCLTVLVTLGAQGQGNQGPPSEREKALEEYSRQGERLKAYANRHWNDVQALLGLAVLYDTYGTPRSAAQTKEVPVGSWGTIDSTKTIPEEKEAADEKLYRRVLALEPQNRPAWAALARIRARYCTSMRRMWLEQLDAKLRYAKERDLDMVRVPSYSVLRMLLGKDGPFYIDSLTEEVERCLAERRDTTLGLLAKGQVSDPDNALYNYLRAHLLYAIGDPDGAFQELERAAQKPFWNTYQVEADVARATVLKDTKLPTTLNRGVLHVDFLISEIWPQLRSAEKASDMTDDKAAAAKITEIVEAMARHIRNEPSPYESPWVRGIADALENHVKERRQVLQDAPAPVQP
jgi:tetratricopeptide (TPR) repeat protein